jgi:hypothetical protein
VLGRGARVKPIALTPHLQPDRLELYIANISFKNNPFYARSHLWGVRLAP